MPQPPPVEDNDPLMTEFGTDRGQTCIPGTIEHFNQISF